MLSDQSLLCCVEAECDFHGNFCQHFALCFLGNVCLECVGKKSEFVKSPLQGMKKKASRTPADSAQNVNTVQNSTKETADGCVKEKKISEKIGRPLDEDKKYKHCDRTKHVQCSKGQDKKALVKDVSKKHRIDSVNPQQLQKDMETNKMNDNAGLLKEYPVSAPECPDAAKKRKLCDADGKWTETCVDNKLSEHSLVEHQKDRNSRGLQHYSKTEQRENSAKVQILERHERPGEKVVRKSSVEVKTEPDDRAERDSSKPDMEKLSNTRKTEHSKDSGRQHARHGLYRALSSR